ncbi:MAG: DUF2125 domain-containing protein [Paracoccaceae bacterium]
MRLVKAVAGLVVLAALGWCGYWFAAASAQESGLEAWLDARRAEGWLAETQAVEIEGFPLAFERRLEAPELADPQAGWSWRAPFLAMTSEAWDPTHVRIAFPEAQSVAVPGRRLDVTAGRLEALAAVVPSRALRLRALGLDAEALVIADAGRGADALALGAERLSLALDRLPTEKAPENAYDVAIEAEGVRLPSALGEAFGAADGAAGRLRARGRIVADRPLDREVIEEGEIGLATLVVSEGRLSYAGIGFDVSGRLDADAEGYAEGTLDVEAQDWRRLLDGLEAAGSVGQATAAALRQGLRLVTLFSDDERLDITLRFSDGRMRIGPVAIGDAPRLSGPNANS